MSGSVKYWIAVALPVAGLALLGLAVPSMMPSIMTNSNAKFVFDTAEVSYGSIRKVVSTSGPVRALVTVSVGSQLSGQISELKADFNSEVKAGDVLAVIDDKMYVAKVTQAMADLAAARAMLANQEAVLVRVEAIERNASRLMGRQQALASKGIAAITTLDNATRDADVARADIEVARAQVENAKAILAQRAAQLSQAQIDLDRTRIRSPIDGTVIARTVDIGQTVAASLQAPEIFKIAQDLTSIRIEAQVSEADIGAVAEGNAVEFSVDAYPERRLQGRVAQVRLAAIELNNVVTYTVMIEAANDDRKLFPGMTANVQIESSKRENVLRVANDALHFKPRAGTVLATGGNQIARRLDQELQRVQTELALTGPQFAKVVAAMKGAQEEPRLNESGGSAVAFSGTRASSGNDTEGQMVHNLRLAVASAITEDQRPAFDAWKARHDSGRGRSSHREVTVWVLSTSGLPEDRQIRLGLADDLFTEALGDALKPGDRIVLRSRETAGK